ncbi:MAG: hypothetical protein JST81_09900 [Bacteroidetes bacterium]|nr:hypothetical protein [Bacteroidota bacterium]
MKIIFIPFFVLIGFFATAQAKPDSTIEVGKKVITLHNLVLNNKLNVASFIEHVKNDSSFYKAFRNLRILNFSAINDIRMLKKNGDLLASLHSKTRQIRSANCRRMETLEETTTGDIYDDQHEFNYYTAQMYASLFFTKDSVCNETNIVKGTEFSTEGKSGMEKHKQQLKMLFFNPGKRISGLPFMSNKTAIYDDDIADRYDMSIDFDAYNGTSCYIFKQKVKPGKEDAVVVDEMTTWFNDSTYEVVARNYVLSYDAGVYDFKVSMEVQMGRFQQLTVPVLIRYNGNWKAIFKKRERGVFTATLFDFY